MIYEAAFRHRGQSYMVVVESKGSGADLISIREVGKDGHLMAVAVGSEAGLRGHEELDQGMVSAAMRATLRAQQTERYTRLRFQEAS